MAFPDLLADTSYRQSGVECSAYPGLHLNSQLVMLL
jgi:hypothetical protein